MKRMHMSGVLVAALLCLALTPAVMAPVSSQILPSHVQMGVSPTGTPSLGAHLDLFEPLVMYARGIVANVTAGNFTAAKANYNNYARTADAFASLNITNYDASLSIDAIGKSKVDLSTLIDTAQEYGNFSQRQTVMLASSPFGNESVRNTLAMQRLLSDLHGIESTITSRTDDIYHPAIDSGFDPSLPRAISAALTNYTTQVANRFSSVSDVVFTTTTVTLRADRQDLRYADVLHLSGDVAANMMPLPNGSVIIFIDGKEVANASTDATGTYAAALAIENVSAGQHAVVAHYAPTNVPYKASNSTAVNVTVGVAPAGNTITANSLSLSPLRKVRVAGTVDTDYGPVKNASVALYVGDKKVSGAKTNANGTYQVNYAIGIPEYVTALVSPRPAAYTMFEADGLPLQSVRTDLGDVIIDVAPAYLAVGAVIVSSSLLVAYRLMPRIRRQKRAPMAPEGAIESLTDVEEALEPPALEAPAEDIISPHALTVIVDAEREAHALMSAGNFAGAITALYHRAIELLSARGAIVVTSNLTHWELFSTVERSAPDVAPHMHTLTYLYELATYSGRPLTETHAAAALRAFESVYAAESAHAAGEMSGDAADTRGDNT